MFFAQRVKELFEVFGLDLDNPAHFGSSVGLLHSPIDFLLTHAALLLSIILVARSKEEPDLFAYALSYDWPGSNFGYEGVYFWVDGEFVQVN